MEATSDGGNGEQRGGADGHDAAAVTRLVLRPFGSPLPIGFFAFGVGVLLTALPDLGAVPPSDARLLAVVVLAFCAPVELIGAVLAFFARDGAGGTILALFGTSLLIAVAAMKSKPFFGVLLIVAAARFALVAVYQLFAVAAVRPATGIVGLLLTLVALYGGEALLLEDTQQRTVLPLFRRARARVALEGDLGDQLARVTREAGVRDQL